MWSCQFVLWPLEWYDCKGKKDIVCVQSSLNKRISITKERHDSNVRKVKLLIYTILTLTNANTISGWVQPNSLILQNSPFLGPLLWPFLFIIWEQGLAKKGERRITRLTRQLLVGDIFLLWLLGIRPCIPIPAAMELEYSLPMSSTAGEWGSGRRERLHINWS